jgi:hypothetical protein
MTFVRNHAQAMLACDFFVSVTAGFQIVYVFVIMEIGTRRLVHFNVTAHPNAAWTLQQFREAFNDHQGYRFLLHDRDSIYSQELDLRVKAMGVKVLKTPFAPGEFVLRTADRRYTPGMSRFSDPDQRESSEKNLK